MTYDKEKDIIPAGTGQIPAKQGIHSRQDSGLLFAAGPVEGSSQTLVLHTETGREQVVMNAIRTYVLHPSEEIYFPIVELSKRIHGQDRMIEKSLYPGYLFIHTDDPTGVYFRTKESQGKTVFKYIRLLRNEQIMLPISRQEEQMLYDLCGDDHRCDFSRGLIKGGKVIITSGPLKNFKGQIKSINRHKKTALITTHLFNRQMDVQVGLEIISKEP